jgi:hypothetical protein
MKAITIINRLRSLCGLCKKFDFEAFNRKLEMKLKNGVA